MHKEKHCKELKIYSCAKKNIVPNLFGIKGFVVIVGVVKEKHCKELIMVIASKYYK
jgi:hypothetical protein